jgi:hypothetical protein
MAKCAAHPHGAQIDDHGDVKETDETLTEIAESIMTGGGEEVVEIEEEEIEDEEMK